jgi:hypothetical protein
MRFNILTCSSTVDGGDGYPRATITFSDKEGLGQFREWIDASATIDAEALAKRKFITRLQLFKALIRGKL